MGSGGWRIDTGRQRLRASAARMGTVPDPRPDRCGSCASGSWGSTNRGSARRMRSPSSRAAIASAPPTQTSTPATAQPKGRAALVGVRRNSRPARDTDPQRRRRRLVPAECGSSGLVKRSGTRLMLRGQPYHFTGIEHLHGPASGGTPSSCGGALYPVRWGLPLSKMPRGTVRSLLGVPELLRIQTVIRLDELRPRAQDRGGSRLEKRSPSLRT